MIFEKTFKLETFLPPVIASIGGKTFVCPGWIDITDKVKTNSLDKIHTQLMKHWVRLEPIETEEKPKFKIEELVTSSKGDTQYTVTFDGSYWNCTCVGFGFRRDCKHVQSIKKMYNINKLK